MSGAAQTPAQDVGPAPWSGFRFVYPVVSRRAGGVSLGVNLNPDKDCNFDCVYCQVDRSVPPTTLTVELDGLESELRSMIGLWAGGELFRRPPFVGVPAERRRLNDIAFSGDGEPTTSPVFLEAVSIAARLRKELLTGETKIILITDSTCLDRENVRAGLEILKGGAYELWAKLDAGTEDYYHRINRSRVPFAKVLDNIARTSQGCPLTIQSLFLGLHDDGPSRKEIEAYCDRIEAMLASGGQIVRIQIGTIARTPSSPSAMPLSDDRLLAIAAQIKARNGLPQQVLLRGMFQVSRQAVSAANS